MREYPKKRQRFSQLQNLHLSESSLTIWMGDCTTATRMLKIQNLDTKNI